MKIEFKVTVYTDALEKYYGVTSGQASEQIGYDIAAALREGLHDVLIEVPTNPAANKGVQTEAGVYHDAECVMNRENWRRAGGPEPLSEGGPPYDAATATGMYDREDG